MHISRHLRPRTSAAVLTAMLAMTSAAAVAAPVPARPADDFVDTIGVNIHLHFTGGVYDLDFATVIKPRLAALGIRHVRDGVYTYPEANADTFFYKRVRELGALGIRFDLITGMDTNFGDTTDFSKLTQVYTWCDGAVASFEGVNEPNLQNVPDWIEQTKFVQQSLYEVVKAAPELGEVKVFGPSPVLGGGLKLGDVSAWLDHGNAHPYPGGECPTCGDVYGQGFEFYMPEFTAPSGDAVLAMTETGYHNAINAKNNHRPASELAAGKYMPRLFLEYFNRGFVRTFSYEFIDQHDDPARTDPEKNFGLLRSDGSEKPAYVAMQSLIGLLADPGAGFAPDSLDYGLEGEVDRVHTTLLQKRDGRFFMALWLERSSYDTGARPNLPDDFAARGDLEVPPQAVTLTLTRPFAAAKLHQFSDDGTIASEMIDPLAALAITVRDRLLVVELIPDAAPDTGDTGDVTGNTGDTGDTGDTGGTADTSHTSDTGDTADTGATSATSTTSVTGDSDTPTGDGPGADATTSPGDTAATGSESSSGAGQGDDTGGCACRPQPTHTTGITTGSIGLPWLAWLYTRARRRRRVP